MAADRVTRHFQTPTSRRLDEYFAWVVREPDGSEGIPAANIGGLTLPLVGGDVERMRSLRPYAEQVRRQTGWPVMLVRYSRREDLEELP